MLNITFKISFWTKIKCWSIWEHAAFVKEVAFNAIEVFQQGQEYHGLDVWQKYEEFGIGILDFADTSIHLLYFGIKKYIISMIPTLLKQRLRQSQHFGRLASTSLDQCRDNALDWYNANKFTNKDESVSIKGCESFHYQAFTRVFFSILNHFHSIMNENQLKCSSYNSFKQWSVLWHCLNSGMFSEED